MDPGIQKAIGVTGCAGYFHVLDVQRSIDFYTDLGMVCISRFGPEGEPVWAQMAAGSQRLMFAKSSGPIDAGQQAAMLYMYSEDVRGLKDHLVSCGVTDAKEPYQGGEVSIHSTGVVFDAQPMHHMPAGEIRVHDPDGYVILVGQLD